VLIWGVFGIVFLVYYLQQSYKSEKISFFINIKGVEMMGGENERRKHRRLLVRMGILCRKVGTMDEKAFVGNSVNISPDGLLIESGQEAAMDTGDLFNVELDISRVDRTDQIGGKVSAYARVVRVIEPQSVPKTNKKQVAFQFCSRPQFDV